MIWGPGMRVEGVCCVGCLRLLQGINHLCVCLCVFFCVSHFLVWPEP